MNPVPLSPSGELDRRAAIKWMLAAAGGAWMSQRVGGAPKELTATPLPLASAPAVSSAQGYGLDPKLTALYRGGEFWPLILAPEQLRLTAVLCDLIIPADEVSPSGSALNVHHFINEWISAPYPAHLQDKALLLDGFAWLDQRSQALYGKLFVDLDDDARRKICDPISFAPKAGPELTQAARFFARFRDLVAGGFYSTPEGMKDIGYIGNVPLPSFEGPSQAVLKQVGLI